MKLSAKDIREFSGYLRNCTDRQVQGCYDKEKAADRDGYVALCESEALRRGIVLEYPCEDLDESVCTNRKGHEWVCTGTAYGGDDESYHGEGRCYCIHCGADGDG